MARIAIEEDELKSVIDEILKLNPKPGGGYSGGKTKIQQYITPDFTIKNNDGATALHNAAFFGNVEIAQILIDAKADKSIKNNFQATARESILAPFEQMKPVYKMLQQQLGPLGLKIDLAEIEKNRPVIAMMLQ